MKKVFLFATAAFIMSGVAFAGGDHKHGKNCAKSKECMKDMKDCDKKDMKDCKMKEGEMKACCKKKEAVKGTN